ncbi:MAG: cell division protein SepF [Clostridia bacterium]|nr:cell division protein SepF [Clostridia bacterium]
MASSTDSNAGVKGVVSKVKDFVLDLFRPVQEEDLYGDDEVFETEEPVKEAPAVFMSEKSEPAETGSEEITAEKVNTPGDRLEEKKKESFGFSSRRLYAYSNDYTGSRGYDDNSSVAFSLAGNTSFGRRRTETVEMPASSVVFSEPATAPVRPSTSTVAASAAGDKVTDSESSPEINYSYSGSRAPATFGSTPITRYETSAPARDVRTAAAGDDSVTVRAKAVVGFNTNGASGGSSAASGYTGQRTSKYGGMTMDNTTVQVLRPTEISEATAAGSLLKKGIVVICNLSEIPDKNTRIRFSDFLCGCCKGCDADFSEIISVESPNAVLIAVPSNVTLKNAVETTKTEEKPAAAPQLDIGGADLNDIFSYTPGEDARASSYFDIDF